VRAAYTVFRSAKKLSMLWSEYKLGFGFFEVDANLWAGDRFLQLSDFLKIT
jgi:hypothetical protein